LGPLRELQRVKAKEKWLGHSLDLNVGWWWVLPRAQHLVVPLVRL